MPLKIDRTRRLPDSEYFPERQRKTGIALHHTVCESALTAIQSWLLDVTPDGSRRHVATAYVIDRDGTIFEVFDPAAWAWQFGLSWRDEQRLPFEKRFIGIELANRGGLIEEHGELYAHDLVTPETLRPRGEAFACSSPYRGYQWFERYQEPQLEALGRLVDELCNRFAIPRIHPDRPFLYYGTALASFEGVIGHAMVRSDKSDPAPDPRLWQAIENLAGLKSSPLEPSGSATQKPIGLSRLDISLLFDRNTRRLDRMETAAGSLVKNLMMELERRGVYLKLAEPAIGSHAIEYDISQGDREQVALLAHALGFKTVTDRLLEVGH
jgi:hypothetical protein